MKTVQRVPKSTGFVDSMAIFAKVLTSVPMVCAKVCRKDPQPEEQASLTEMESTA